LIRLRIVQQRMLPGWRADNDLPLWLFGEDDGLYQPALPVQAPGAVGLPAPPDELPLGSTTAIDDDADAWPKPIAQSVVAVSLAMLPDELPSTPVALVDDDPGWRALSILTETWWQRWVPTEPDNLPVTPTPLVEDDPGWKAPLPWSVIGTSWIPIDQDVLPWIGIDDDGWLPWRLIDLTVRPWLPIDLDELPLGTVVGDDTLWASMAPRTVDVATVFRWGWDDERVVPASPFGLDDTVWLAFTRVSESFARRPFMEEDRAEGMPMPVALRGHLPNLRSGTGVLEIRSA
jgi:hypothetical protein